MKWIMRFAVVFLGLMMMGGPPEKPPPNRPSGEPTAPPEGEGWVDLLDAEHAPEWQSTTREKTFELDGGVLHIPGSASGSYIGYMEEEFGDFALHIEFRLGEGANSGLMFRAVAKDPVYKGMEIQVLGDHGRPPSTHSCGALYDVAAPMFNLSRPAGKWNSCDMTCQGQDLEVVMNGWKILDVDLSKMTMRIGKFPTPLAALPQEGHVLLQDHHDEVWYRNIRVKKL